MTKTKHDSVHIVFLTLFAAYLILLLKITVFRKMTHGVQSVNLIPFATITEYFQFIISGNRIIGIINVFGNILAFLPFGYLTAFVFPKMRKSSRILVLTAVFSIVIEVFQFILACGSSDIDDVILNALGGVMGYWVYVAMSKLLRPKKYAIYVSALMIISLCIGFYSFNNYSYSLPSPGNLHAFAESHNDTYIGANNGAYAYETAWFLILINKWNTIPEDYKLGLTELKNGQSVDMRIYPALQEMFDAARSDGVYPIVASGYRTSETQQNIMDEKIAEYIAEGYSDKEAIVRAEACVAIPGTSEHQIGISVDINADGVNSTGEEVYEWLSHNSYKFGFIRRYPENKTKITGVINEPWHYRYVGVDAASEIYDRDICLEEYLDEPLQVASNRMLG